MLRDASEYRGGTATLAGASTAFLHASRMPYFADSASKKKPALGRP